MSSSFWNNHFKPAQDKAGVSCRFHDLRHTAVALWKLSTVAADASFDRVNNSGSARNAALLASA
jgi:hypothetical protein